MCKFRPAVKSGQWQVDEARDRLLQLTLALTLTHSYPVNQSPECEHSSPVSLGQTDSHHIRELAEDFFPMSTAQTCSEGSNSHLYEALSWVPGQGMPG